ncbi:hypothetical protein WMY93_031756 [Mugilogobius chulae]|uniref:Spindle and kinetochore-associated protein 3 n=1 Tax=Mugilogobius chulae TaxID=88201 RepID=A0AAW0MLC6_9GOBI
MTTEPLQYFRSFITESFTAVAVNIFNEVQNLVQSYEDENKRLRTLLNSVLQPEVQLSRIDVGSSGQRFLTRAEPRTRPVVFGAELAQPKEEQMECVITNDIDQVKLEPDVVPITVAQSLVDVNDTSSSSITASASASVSGDVYSSSDEEEEEAENEGGEGGGEEVEEENMENEDTSAAQEEPLSQKTLLECPRFKKPDASFLPTPSEYKAFISRLTEAYKDMPPEQRPLITLMGLDQDVEFVDCALGKVPKGCPLSYHYPLPSESDFKPLSDAPPQPGLPLQSQSMPTSVIPQLTSEEQEVFNGMTLTWEGAYSLENRRDKYKNVPRK